jgi:putative isomerase
MDSKTIVRDFICEHFSSCINPPAGELRHPFIEPGAGYGGTLWDWDSYFCLLGLEPWHNQIAEVTRGCVLNYLIHQRKDGSIPYVVTSKRKLGESQRATDEPANSMKPLLAQFALLAKRYTGETEWLREKLNGIIRHLNHWEVTQRATNGLFTYRSHRGSGTDDHPAVYGRPFNSSADVFLNSLMVKEYRAVATLCSALQNTAEANEPAYAVVAGGNPSCWRGPIWIIANYLTWRALRRYGYHDEAEKLAATILDMMAHDISTNGCLHEYYHPETGRGLINPGFLNWNTLGAVIGT